VASSSGAGVALRVLPLRAGRAAGLQPRAARDGSADPSTDCTCCTATPRDRALDRLGGRRRWRSHARGPTGTASSIPGSLETPSPRRGPGARGEDGAFGARACHQIRVSTRSRCAPLDVRGPETGRPPRGERRAWAISEAYFDIALGRGGARRHGARWRLGAASDLDGTSNLLRARKRQRSSTSGGDAMSRSTVASWSSTGASSGLGGRSASAVGAAGGIRSGRRRCWSASRRGRSRSHADSRRLRDHRRGRPRAAHRRRHRAAREVDGLINNAGFGRHRPALRHVAQDVRQTCSS